jgi:hypothetical protein
MTAAPHSNQIQTDSRVKESLYNIPNTTAAKMNRAISSQAPVVDGDIPRKGFM